MLDWFQDAARRCLVVAEIGQAHDGSLGMAHAYIDAVADAGAGAIKFQTHIASAESTPAEPWRVRFSSQDASRFDYWKRMEFAPTAWAELAAHAAERQLVFLSSPFSIEAVDLLEGVGMAAWKIGSGETTNLALLKRVAETGRPVLLSSGMSTWDELDTAVDTIRSAGAPLLVFQCTSAYPTPADRVGLNVLAELRARYGCPVGLSDHSGQPHAGLAAVALGADMIEVHVTWSRACFGPDVPASLLLPELKQLVEGTAFIQTALRNPIDKEQAATSLAALKQTFEKSIVALRPLPAGTQLTAADLGLKKPGTGLPAADLPGVLGRTLRVGIEVDALLRLEDLE